jgi:hypothetical protein
LIYIALLSASGAACGLSQRMNVARLLVVAMTALVAAWWLVPTWDNLQPSRPVWIGILAAYLAALAILMQTAAGRGDGHRVLLVAMSLSALAIALLTATMVSVSLAWLSACASAALVGCGLVSGQQAPRYSVRALVPVYALVVGGCAFVSAIEPSPPLPGFLLAAAAPLAMALIPRARTIRSSRTASHIYSIAATCALLATAAGWLYLQTRQNRPTTPASADYFDESWLE